MSIYPNVTEKFLFNSRKLEDEQKNQRALRIKNRNLNPAQYKKLAESHSPITKKLDEVIESTKKLKELFEKTDAEDGKIQTPAIENITGTRSLRDT